MTSSVRSVSALSLLVYVRAERKPMSSTASTVITCITSFRLVHTTATTCFPFVLSHALFSLSKLVSSFFKIASVSVSSSCCVELKFHTKYTVFVCVSHPLWIPSNCRCRCGSFNFIIILFRFIERIACNCYFHLPINSQSIDGWNVISKQKNCDNLIHLFYVSLFGKRVKKPNHFVPLFEYWINNIDVMEYFLRIIKNG